MKEPSTRARKNCDLIDRVMDCDVSTFCAVFVLKGKFILTFLAYADK